ncbi:alkaline shock response membrane anchor protein AmaP [Streptomyces formicae]|uniref:Putative membrane protein n=1 Tax=Streptomyces formicae TaxID=1616117 RepID=A0A291QJ29_9ACTN|nr:alkaline shock response membrane anchor protein AmaP [Streptomyces formicae]ATL31537.1 putative membrane protein [Streptomyces formicae]
MTSGIRGGANRAALACAAAVLLGAGATLASATGPVRDRLPAGWPRLDDHRVWLDAGALERWRDHTWWPAALLAALSLAFLLLAYVAVAQVRAGRLRALPLGRGDVTLAGPALGAALAERAGAIDGVRRAQVHILGRPHRLRASITLVLDPDASPSTVLRTLSEDAITEARAAAAPRELTADVRIKVRSHRAERVH